MGGTVKVDISGKSVDLPILKGSAGPDVIDIRKLYAATDAFTYDPGFTSTASCESRPTSAAVLDFFITTPFRQF